MGTYTNAVVKKALDRMDSAWELIPRHQALVVRGLLRGEDGDAFPGILLEISKAFNGMPKTYETQEQGDHATAWLHYFSPSGDWWITEKDVDSDGEGQVQAFGYVDLGYGMESGYISILELRSCSMVELDFYWKPKTVAEIKANRRTM
jgi:hypothetical protein